VLWLPRPARVSGIVAAHIGSICGFFERIHTSFPIQRCILSIIFDRASCMTVIR
jgi:hypothetical protein